MRTIEQILKETKVIAVVGLSDKPDRPSFGVAMYLQSQGYRIIPVNPNITEALGEKAYPNLTSVPHKIDLVDIFRRPADVPPVVDEAIARLTLNPSLPKDMGFHLERDGKAERRSNEAPAVWMQLGIVNQPTADKAASAGLDVVMDHCAKVEHQKLRAQRKL